MCFLCKTEGHLAKYCPTTNSQDDTVTITSQAISNAQQANIDTETKENNSSTKMNEISETLQTSNQYKQAI